VHAAQQATVVNSIASGGRLCRAELPAVEPVACLLRARYVSLDGTAVLYPL
jgi:hypothetical protein